MDYESLTELKDFCAKWSLNLHSPASGAGEGGAIDKLHIDISEN